MADLGAVSSVNYYIYAKSASLTRTWLVISNSQSSRLRPVDLKRRLELGHVTLNPLLKDFVVAGKND